MFDPQTSGGLVIGIREERARELMNALIEAGVSPIANIGEVLEPDPEGHVEIV